MLSIFSCGCGSGGRYGWDKGLKCMPNNIKLYLSTTYTMKFKHFPIQRTPITKEIQCNENSITYSIRKTELLINVFRTGAHSAITLLMYLGFQELAAVRFPVYWVVMLCSTVGGYQRFGDRFASNFRTDYKASQLRTVHSTADATCNVQTPTERKQPVQNRIKNTWSPNWAFLFTQVPPRFIRIRDCYRIMVPPFRHATAEAFTVW